MAYLFPDRKKAGAPVATAATAPRTPGLFTERGVTYGSESIGKPREEWAPLEPEEIERRRGAHGVEDRRRVKKRRGSLLSGTASRGGGTVLGG